MRLPGAAHSLKIDHALSIYDLFHTISGYFATNSFWSKQCGHALPAKVHWLMPQKLDDNWTNKVSSTCWVPPVCLLGKLISCNQPLNLDVLKNPSCSCNSITTTWILDFPTTFFQICQSLSNLGKFLRIPGKVFLQKYTGKEIWKEMFQSFQYKLKSSSISRAAKWSIQLIYKCSFFQVLFFSLVCYKIKRILWIMPRNLAFQTARIEDIFCSWSDPSQSM